MKRILIVFALLLSYKVLSQPCILRTNIVYGVYTGKNLFFSSDERYGVKKIFLNDKLMSDSLGTAFELDLSFLKRGEKVKIGIHYCGNIPEPYKILNLEAIEEKGVKKE